MNQLIWSLFSHTGSIETYLLLKQIENEKNVQPSLEYNQEMENDGLEMKK